MPDCGVSGAGPGYIMSGAGSGYIMSGAVSAAVSGRLVSGAVSAAKTGYSHQARDMLPTGNDHHVLPKPLCS